MEFLNKIELRGIVGFSQTIKCLDTCVTKFSLLTERVIRCTDGTSLVETTWFQITMNGDKPPISKGDKVYVCGRLRAMRYTDHSGRETLHYEVCAEKVEALKD